MTDEMTRKLNSPADVLDAFCNLLSGLKVSTPSLNLTSLQCWHIGRNAVDRIAQLEAQLEAVKQDDWQPIETAPKLGEFQVYMPNEKTKIQTANARKSFTVIGGVFAFDLTAPTHWKPQSKPPIVTTMQPREPQ
jgi:hypothetical protein